MGGGGGLVEGAVGGDEGTANCCWLTCTMLAELTLTPVHQPLSHHLPGMLRPRADVQSLKIITELV